MRGWGGGGRAPVGDSPFGDLKGEGGRPSEGEEGADEDRGGRVGFDNLLPEEDPVSGWGESPGKAVAGKAGGDRPEGDRGGRATQLRPQPRADLGEPAEGRRPQQAPGESVAEEGAFQDKLIQSTQVYCSQ